ncbi:MAG: hypothetical protein FWD74_03345, partial [Actinomycetia bacterium]|nr:hypothetical protein [Actinomycetes bacterium]
MARHADKRAGGARDRSARVLVTCAVAALTVVAAVVAVLSTRAPGGTGIAAPTTPPLAANSTAAPGAGVDPDASTGHEAGSHVTGTATARPTRHSPPAGAGTATESVSASPTRTKPRTNAPAPTNGLPLRQPTGNATQVVTVVASSTAATTATIRAWTRAGSVWKPFTAPIAGFVGSDGLSTSPSATRAATPIGSFTLTQAFGTEANPGTALRYFQTTPADWWIGEDGPLYNTHQRCASNCPFTQGAPNEHLYYETPYYNYAVVIDYNTRNAGPVVPGA